MFNMNDNKTPDPGRGAVYTWWLLFNDTDIGVSHFALWKL